MTEDQTEALPTDLTATYRSLKNIIFKRKITLPHTF
jgi:hypothetical protein